MLFKTIPVGSVFTYESMPYRKIGDQTYEDHADRVYLYSYGCRFYGMPLNLVSGPDPINMAAKPDPAPVLVAPQERAAWPQVSFAARPEHYTDNFRGIIDDMRDEWTAIDWRAEITVFACLAAVGFMMCWAILRRCFG